MSEVTVHPRRQTLKNADHKPKIGKSGPRRPNYNTIHRNLLPVELHPLPTLIPHNPLSLVAIALSYLVQVLAPPKRTIYKGYFSSATSSVHITDEETQRALWEQGFFGRGSLSRSEPTWLENQKKAGLTAEENTDKRRKERRQFKLDRAKQEQVDIEVQLMQQTGSLQSVFDVPAAVEISESAPIIPDVVKTKDHDLDTMQSTAASEEAGRNKSQPQSVKDITEGTIPVLPPKLFDLREDDGVSSANDSVLTPTLTNRSDVTFEGFEEWKKAVGVNGLPTPPPTSTCSETSPADPLVRPAKKLLRQKTVRFSPTIEAREFDLSSPVISPIKAPGTSPVEEEKPVVSLTFENKTKNQEHLQISLEEAFFLSYGLGVLEVYPSSEVDQSSTPLSTSSLLSLFRRHSYYPARSLSISSQPDDPFMLSYAAYHHFRSMGWVVRSGVKFGVDYLLYNRGPAFSHAEFAVIVLPSYSDIYWSEEVLQGRQVEGRSWSWLHGINRVQAQVHKSLILCYVDVPAPNGKDRAGYGVDEQGSGIDIGALLISYKVRGVNVKRWTPNRSRD